MNETWVGSWSAERLVLWAVKSVGLRKSRPRWETVASMFAVGSATARELCRMAGVDPDERAL